MDLEHTNLGKHCQVSDCKQRDFLPFTCDICKLTLCLEHRHYSAHSCSGGGLGTKDMTSIDCPMCGLSVKFPKSRDADSVWTEHYLSNCTQKLKKNTTVTCYENSCQRLLGPSNDYICAKCKQHVCLSHRLPEDHHCLGMRGAILSKLPPQTTTTNTSSSHASKPQTKPSASKPQAAASVEPVFGYDRVYKGGTTKQQQAVPQTKPEEEFECPLCSRKFPNSDYLQTHVNSAHSEIMYSDTVPPPSSSVPSVHESVTTTHRRSDPNQHNPLAREVCPQCQMRFVDAIELVNHFETAHPPRSLPPKKNDDCVLG